MVAFGTALSEEASSTAVMREGAAGAKDDPHMVTAALG